jgi:hypothetical protein
MSDQDQVIEETLDTQEDVSLNDTEVEQEEVDVAALQAELAKQKELANNYKIRAEKAEKKPAQVISQPTAQPTHSLEDQIAIIKANVALEDLSEVQEFAKFKKITISEALQSPTLKAILADNAEKRQTALAANVATVKRGSQKSSDEALWQKAQKGELPQTPEEAEKIFRMRKGLN